MAPHSNLMLTGYFIHDTELQFICVSSFEQKYLYNHVFLYVKSYGA